ncbi:unnamed protein product [Camellia sinensis]
MDPTTNTNHRGTENETPPPPPPPPLAATTAQPNTKSLSFTNGKLKKHSNHPHHHHPPQPPAAVIYKECLKNHAATLGGYAVDGCGEFMPSPTDPTSLKCAACGCHRNFHRRGDEPTTTTPTHFLDFHHRSPPPLSVRRSSPSSSSPSPPPPPSYYSSAAPHMLLALSAADHHHPEAAVKPTAEENPSGRKRNRTKFSQDQKEKMLSFSEKLGWKMMKSDQGLIESFCNEIGVGRGVLKVWMHNNKNTFGKKDATTTTINNVSENINDGRVKSENNGDHHHHQHQSENNNGVHHLHVSSANGCPSAQLQLDPKIECRF